MKKITFLAAMLFLSQQAKSQDYYHAIGGAYNIGLYQRQYTSEIENIDYSETSALGVGLIVYKATLAFEMSRSSSFAVSAYPG